MSSPIVMGKSYAFALRIVRLTRYLAEEKREYVLGKQLLRSGTAIGALIREAEYAESTPDFIHKRHIALKEANETDYWLSLLKDSGYISDNAYQSMKRDIDEIISLLVSSLKTMKEKLKKEKEGNRDEGIGKK